MIMTFDIAVSTDGAPQDDFGRIARDDAVRRETAVHHAARSHDGVIPDDRSIEDHAVRADPDISPDANADRSHSLLVDRHIERSVAVVLAYDRHVRAEQRVVADLDPGRTR